MTKNDAPKKVYPLALWLALVPAIAMPVMATAGGKSWAIIFAGIWLCVIGVGLELGRRKYGARVSLITVSAVCVAGVSVTAIAFYLCYTLPA